MALSSLSSLQFCSFLILSCREEKLQLEKRQKRKKKLNARLSFDLDDGNEEEEEGK